MIVASFASLFLFASCPLINSKFCNEFKDIHHEFYPLRHCQRSNKTVIAYSNEDSLEDCAEFSRYHRGLAFNFSPIERRKKNLYNIKQAGDLGEFYSCEVLECPEYSNFSSMVNDTRYDYYSLFTHQPPSGDATCIPSVGMFMLVKMRSNYSVAQNVCESFNGNLAHIASKVRNYKLSKFLMVSTNTSTKERTAYVGLNETEVDKFFTSYNEPLRCFNFRAWAPGHPSEVRRPGCVAITPEKSWKVFNCNRKLMFVCELFTSGPNPFINNINEKCTTDRPNNRFMPTKTSTY